MKKNTTLTIGMDIGDRKCHVVVLAGNDADPTETAMVKTTRESMQSYFESKPISTVAIEVGTHSAWICTLLQSLGHTVIVANPRQVRLISNSWSKTDWADAEKLARLARIDPRLLHPIQHRGSEAQELAAFVRARDAAVRARTKFVNHIRGVVKGIGERLPQCSTPSFIKHMDTVPPERREALEPLKKCLEVLNNTIKHYDRVIEKKGSELGSVVSQLTQVDGIGTLTAVAYVSCIEDPHRFEASRTAGAFLGLCSRNKSSSSQDPELSISKCGDSYVRHLLVSAAHRIIGPFGKESDLRTWGIKLAGQGKNSKKRAAVAVARKLAVLLHQLWKTGDDYKPLKNPKVTEQIIDNTDEYKALFAKTKTKTKTKGSRKR